MENNSMSRTDDMSKENSNNIDEKGPIVVKKAPRSQNSYTNDNCDQREDSHENVVSSLKKCETIKDSAEKLNNLNSQHVPTKLKIKQETKIEMDISLECDENMDFDSQDEESRSKREEAKHNKLVKNTSAITKDLVIHNLTSTIPRRQRKQILQTRFEDKDELVFTTETEQKRKKLPEKKKSKPRNNSLGVSLEEKTSKPKKKQKMIKSCSNQTSVEPLSVKTDFDDQQIENHNGEAIENAVVKVELDMDNDADMTKSSDENEEKQNFKRRMGRPKGSKDKIKRKRRGKVEDENEIVMDSRSKQEIDDSDEDFIELNVNSLNIKKLGGKKANRGPVIRITGSRERPKSCSILNIPSTESGVIKYKTKRTNSASLSVKPASSPMITSTVCTQSDGWTCSLCSKPSYYGDLGELYGPYYPPGHKIAENNNLHVKNKKTDHWKKVDNNFKGKVGRGADLEIGTKKNYRKRKHSESSGEDSEFWVHAACAVWADGVFMVGSGLYGLQQAVKSARQVKCVVCKNGGATLGCLTKGCHEVFHFICAVEKGCMLLEENFTMLCSIHKNKPVKMKE